MFKFNKIYSIFNHPNQPVDNLPSSIQNITFGHAFNKSLNNLPKSIKFIQLSEKYDCRIFKYTFKTY